MQEGSKAGQYALLVNLDREEYIDPKEIGVSHKLREMCADPRSAVLSYLLRKPSGEECGSGDICRPKKGEPKLKRPGNAGRWAGDRISVAGDYDSSGLFEEAKERYKEISGEIRDEVNFFMGSRVCGLVGPALGGAQKFLIANSDREEYIDPAAGAGEKGSPLAELASTCKTNSLYWLLSPREEISELGEDRETFAGAWEGGRVYAVGSGDPSFLEIEEGYIDITGMISDEWNSFVGEEECRFSRGDLDTGEILSDTASQSSSE